MIVLCHVYAETIPEDVNCDIDLNDELVALSDESDQPFSLTASVVKDAKFNQIIVEGIAVGVRYRILTFNFKFFR